MAVRKLEGRPAPDVYHIYIEERDDRLRSRLSAAQRRCRHLHIKTRTGYAWSQLPDDLQRVGAREVWLDELCMSTLDRLWPDTSHVQHLQLHDMPNLVWVNSLPATLTTLAIYDCRQLRMLPCLSEFAALTSIDLCNTAMCPHTLPPALTNFSITLADQPDAADYTKMCDAIESTPTLTSLDVRFDSRVSVEPPDASVLPLLTSLTLFVRGTVPDHVFRCWQLRNLTIGSDPHIVFPEKFAQLRHLCRISFNRLFPATAAPPLLPTSLVDLPMLQYASLYGLEPRDAVGRSIYQTTVARRRCYRSHLALVLCSARLCNMRRCRRLPPELQRMIWEQWLAEIADPGFCDT